MCTHTREVIKGYTGTTTQLSTVIENQPTPSNQLEWEIPQCQGATGISIKDLL